MEYKKIPYVEKPVSRIIYGTAAPGFMNGSDESLLLDAVYAIGVNAFDTARVYALSEKSLGDWVYQRGLREQVVLLSKCGHPSVSGEKRINEQEIRRDFAESSQYLKTDFIDIYLLHRDDPEIEAGVAVEILNALYAEGKIGAFGGSNWTHQRIEEANEYAYKHSLVPFSVSSPNFGLADQICDLWGGGCVSISGSAHKDAREWYCRNQMPVIAYSSLGRGLFSGRVKSSAPERASEVMDAPAMAGYACPENFLRLRRSEELAKKKGCSVAQIAMAWIYRQELNTFAVVSTQSAERMKENAEALEISLSKEELQYLDLQAG